MPSEGDRQGDWAREAESAVRGVAGAFLFGIPFFFTMEVWWIGSYGHPVPRLAAIAATLFVGFLLNRTGGFRPSRRVGALAAARDSVVAVGIGLVCAAVTLILLRRIDGRTPLNEALGQLTYEMVPCALGVTLSNQYLRRQDGDAPEQHGREPTEGVSAALGASMIGAFVVAFAIAPTSEVPIIAAALHGPWLLGLPIMSLLVSYMIVFETGFAGQPERSLGHSTSQTLAAYGVSLVTATLMLLFFQRLSLGDPLEQWGRHALVLGLPAAIGGAAGRLAI